VAPEPRMAAQNQNGMRRIAMDREVRLYIQGHAFKLEGEKYGFFPVDVTGPGMDLLPTYDVSGSSLKVQRVAAADILIRAVGLLQQHRGDGSAKAA
jgi:hypothetical protein